MKSTFFPSSRQAAALAVAGKAARSRSRRVRGRDHHDGAPHALRAEVLLDELAHLAAALAHERDDHDVGLGGARDHAHEGRLADAGSGKEAEPLAAAKGNEGVDRAHPRDKRLADAAAAQRMRRRGRGGAGPAGRQRPEPVEGAAERVEHAAQQLRTGARDGRMVARHHLAAHVEAGGLAERHEQDPVFTETHHFRADAEIVGAQRPHEAVLAEADVRSVGLDDQPGDARDRADALHGRQVADLRPQQVDEGCHAGGHRVGQRCLQPAARPCARALSLVCRRPSVRPKRLRTWQSPGAKEGSTRTRRPG
jgi:hypothetical protein